MELCESWDLENGFALAFRNQSAFADATLELDPPRKARARSPNLQRTGLIGSVTSRDVTKSVNVVLAR